MKIGNLILALVFAALCALIAAFLDANEIFRAGALVLGLLFVAAGLVAWRSGFYGYLSAVWGFWLGVMAIMLTMFVGQATDNPGEWVVPAASYALVALGFGGLVLSLMAQRR